jgi:uncharacterized membrane protein YgcG
MGTTIAKHRVDMRSISILVMAAATLTLTTAACSGGPGAEKTGSTGAAIGTSTIVARGMEWVDADLHYCQAAYGAVDGDSSCWAWEGPSHVCDRESNAAWNAYRSDCSGFVTWAWGLPPVGDGGYTTGDFAPYDTSFSQTIDGSDLQPGDALNKTPVGHIILFKQWVTPGVSAEFMEEPGCSSSDPYAHEFTSSVSISGSSVYVDYEGATFYAIRFDSATVGGSGGSGGSGGTGGSTGAGGTKGSGGSAGAGGSGGAAGSSGSAGSAGTGGSAGTSGTGGAPDACTEGAGFCTATLQCDGGHWIVRQDDPSACTTVEEVQEPCAEGDGYCTETLQCDSGYWVPRTGDPAACTSGPGG